MIEIGLISDTHGLLRPQVHEALAGVSLILHAGDVCGDTILDELALIAPVQAVCGNCDAPWDPALAAERVVEAEGVRIHVSHGHELGRPTAERLIAAYPGFNVIVYGHTHVQKVERLGDALVVNPGAAGHRRFDLHPSVARLRVDGGHAEVTLVALPD
ncbi:MAG: metallophosphoesterase family protein [Gemmatimonadetes bacterium]|nr:metallophosphoesterase family protein [Gemmatimonadota bacterium]